MQNLKVGDHIILDDTDNQRSIPVSAIIFAIYDKLGSDSPLLPPHWNHNDINIFLHFTEFKIKN